MKYRNFKLFLRKVKGFMRRNVYSFAIAFCVIVGVTLVATTVIVTNTRNAAQNQNMYTPVDVTPIDAVEEQPSVPAEIPIEVEPTVPVQEQPTEPVTDPVVPVVSDTVVVFASPLKNYTLGMEFALDKLIYSKTLKQWQTHLGVDMLTSENEEVYSVLDGTIEKVENSVLEGTCITIKHSDSLKTIYKSLSSNVMVEEGDSVTKGQTIGYVSNNSLIEQKEGAHLHLEVLEDNEYVDPLTYFSDGTK